MNEKSNKKRNSLTFKVVSILILLGVLIAFSCGLVGYIQFSNVIEEMYVKETTQVAKIIVDYVNVNNLEEILKKASEATNEDELRQLRQEVVNSEYYRDFVRFLDDLRRNANVTDVYIAEFSDKNDNQNLIGTYFLGVAGVRLDPQISTIGETFTFNDTDNVIKTIYETGNSPVEYQVKETDSGLVMNALLPIKDRKGNVIGIASVEEPMTRLFSAIRDYILSVIFYSLIVTIIVIVIFVIINHKLLVSPIKKITEATKNFTKNNNKISEEILDIKTNDEIQTLSESIIQMEKDIHNYIDNLSRITKDKERVETELNIATEIQREMLPTIFPAYPDRNEFDIYATMEPAKEVGGDFYDLFLIDEDHLAFIAADVSGKGVPAALFMVIAKTLIKDHTLLGESPSEIFTKVNDQLYESNGADMFVTAWLGILEISTGKLTYVNAGHNPPVIKHGNNEYEFMKQRPGLVLAGLDGINYRQAEVDLEPGDKIYLYTDGVTEAQDLSEELYGEKRLLDVLNKNLDTNVFDLLPKIREDIQEFVGNAEQFDDITMVGVEYKGLINEDEKE